MRKVISNIFHGETESEKETEVEVFVNLYRDEFEVDYAECLTKGLSQDEVEEAKEQAIEWANEFDWFDLYRQEQEHARDTWADYEYDRQFEI